MFVKSLYIGNMSVPSIFFLLSSSSFLLKNTFDQHVVEEYVLENALLYTKPRKNSLTVGLKMAFSKDKIRGFGI